MKIDKSVIPQIEKALDFKLRDWQIAYIFEEPVVLKYAMFGRRNGKTTAYILKHALENGDKIISMKSLEFVSDETEPISYRKRFFVNYYLDIVTKLNYAGIKTVQLVAPIF